MASWVRRTAGEIRRGENIDAYLTAAVAIVVAVLNLLGIFPASGLTSLVLAVLGLLAVGALATRARVDQIRDAVTASTLTNQRTFPPTYAQDLTNEGDLWLIGVSRTNLLRTQYHHLADRLKARNTVRVLLIKPGTVAAKLAQQRVPIAVEGEEDDRIKASLDLLRALGKEVSGSLEVRLTEQELPFGAVFVNYDGSAARLYLEYYSYKTRHDSHFRLMLSRRDGQWLDHYREQLDHLWADAEPWSTGS